MARRVEEIKREASTMDRFGQFAAGASYWLGSKMAFVFAGLVIVTWAVSGPIFHYSDTWQLVINTGTTIVTFLMVFLIQNSQNRDSASGRQGGVTPKSDPGRRRCAGANGSPTLLTHPGVPPSCTQCGTHRRTSARAGSDCHDRRPGSALALAAARSTASSRRPMPTSRRCATRRNSSAPPTSTHAAPRDFDRLHSRTFPARRRHDRRQGCGLRWRVLGSRGDRRIAIRPVIAPGDQRASRRSADTHRAQFRESIASQQEVGSRASGQRRRHGHFFGARGRKEIPLTDESAAGLQTTSSASTSVVRAAWLYARTG